MAIGTLASGGILIFRSLFKTRVSAKIPARIFVNVALRLAIIQVEGIFVADSPGDVTLLLAQMRTGRRDALDRLLPLIYDELRSLAGRYMQQERAGHTLQPTALVHEAYLRLTH
jgi:hypothetical protein